MSVEDLVTELARLDLDRDQGRLYVQMLQMGPSKARSLAEAAGFSRTKVYRILEKMVESGIATASVQRPTIFRPVPPDEVFDLLARRFERGAERVETARRHLGDRLEDLARDGAGDGQTDEGPTAPSWRIVQGRADAFDEVCRLIEDAETEFLELSTHPMCTTFTAPVRQAWERLVERATDEGLRFRGIFDTDEEARTIIGQWRDTPGLDIRHVDGDRLVRFVVADRSTAILFLVQDPSTGLEADGDVALVTDAPEAVETLLLSFEAAWEGAAPLEDVLAA